MDNSTNLAAFVATGLLIGSVAAIVSSASDHYRKPTTYHLACYSGVYKIYEGDIIFDNVRNTWSTGHDRDFTDEDGNDITITENAVCIIEKNRDLSK